MKKHIEIIHHLAEVLYSETDGKHTISRLTASSWQQIFDEMQDELDQISNELNHPAE